MIGSNSGRLGSTLYMLRYLARWWMVAVPLLALLALALSWGRELPLVLVVIVAVLLAGAVLAAVHHAEVIAHRVGEPFGSLVLAVAVTVIEVALIVSLMISGGEHSASLARDTVFAAVMITCNGIVGLSLLSGALRAQGGGLQRRGHGRRAGDGRHADHAQPGAADVHDEPPKEARPSLRAARGSRRWCRSLLYGPVRADPDRYGTVTTSCRSPPRAATSAEGTGGHHCRGHGHEDRGARAAAVKRRPHHDQPRDAAGGAGGGRRPGQGRVAGDRAGGLLGRTAPGGRRRGDRAAGAAAGDLAAVRAANATRSRSASTWPWARPWPASG